MTITHREIVDRIEMLRLSDSEALQRERARVAKERESLQELCAGLGHFFKLAPLAVFKPVLQCVYCEKYESIEKMPSILKSEAPDGR